MASSCTSRYPQFPCPRHAVPWQCCNNDWSCWLTTTMVGSWLDDGWLKNRMGYRWLSLVVINHDWLSLICFLVCLWLICLSLTIIHISFIIIVGFFATTIAVVMYPSPSQLAGALVHTHDPVLSDGWAVFLWNTFLPSKTWGISAEQRQYDNESQSVDRLRVAGEVEIFCLVVEPPTAEKKCASQPITIKTVR